MALLVSVQQAAANALATWLSTQLAAVWIREHDLEAALPNAPHITAGPLIALEPEREARP